MPYATTLLTVGEIGGHNTYYQTSSASIAAGGFVTDEHEADIVMQVKRLGGNWGYGTPVPDVPRAILPRLRVSNREGVEKEADSEPQEGTTDAGGRVLSDVLTSRDVESRMYARDLVGVHLGDAQSNWNPIYMHWGDVEWKMGENGDKPWGTRFLLLGDSYTEWAWIKAQSADNKPLKGHTMKLIVDRLQVSQTNSETGAVQTTLYTTDKTEAEQHENNGDGSDTSFVVVYKKDLTSDVSAFVSLPDEISDSGEGVYKGEFTIHKVEGATIDKLKLAIEDQGVYRPVS